MSNSVYLRRLQKKLIINDRLIHQISSCVNIKLSRWLGMGISVIRTSNVIKCDLFLVYRDADIENIEAKVYIYVHI